MCRKVECREGYDIPEDLEEISKEEFSKYGVKSEFFKPLIYESFEKMRGLVREIFEVEDEELFEVNPLFVEVWKNPKKKNINFNFLSFGVEIQIKRRKKLGVIIRTLDDKLEVGDEDYFNNSKKIVEVYDRKILYLTRDFVNKYKKSIDKNIFLEKKY